MLAGAAKQDETNFVSISLATLRIDSTTSFDIFFQPGPDQPMVLYAERNLIFSEAARQRLIDNRVEIIYIRSGQEAAYHRYLERNLTEILSDPAIKPEEKSKILYSSATLVAEMVMANPESQESVKRGKELVRGTVDFMISDPRIFGCLLKAVSSVYKLYTHSINVVTYSVALAQHLGYSDPATLRELAVGAFLHDVGKGRIDSAILDNSGTLTQEQWEELKRHPRYGHEMLMAAGNVGEIALDIVLHHHERLHGGGYPDNVKGDLISTLVRVVSIADVFDALTTDRPFQKSRKTFPALSMMRFQTVNDLDPVLFRRFVELMGSPED